jgi:hypothetical protein
MGASGGIAILENDKSRLRYDPEEDVSRHAAADDECCYEMERKYRWKLKRIDNLRGNIFKVDCIFYGKTEFPKSFYDPEQAENDDA